MAPKLIKRTVFLFLMSLMALSPFAYAEGDVSLEFSEQELYTQFHYTKAISSANPVIAKEFLEDTVFVDKLKTLEPQEAAKLISKAEAIVDLANLLDKRLYKTREYELSVALQIRIDHDKPLASVGIGPYPEPLIEWVKIYRKNYSKLKVALIERSIRKFEVLFGTSAVNGKDKWEKSTIRERNTLLAGKAGDALDGLINHETQTGDTYQNQIKSAGIFEYLDAGGKARLNKYISQMSVAEEAKSSLNAELLAELKDQPIEQQMYLLGSVFDQSDIKAGSLETKIDSLRRSKPSETISYQDNRIIADLLKTAMVSEVKGTVAGDKVVKFYKENKLDIAIASCQNCYAKFEPSNNRIVFDADLIQQYMRIKDISADDFIKGKEINNLAKYLSPMFVHEATHQMQHSWSDGRDIYKPYTQEDEIEANSLEAVYTIEKMKKDKSFSKLFREIKSDSVYAEKRIKLAHRFKMSRDKFGGAIRNLYYYGLPSFSSARAEILKAISDELGRRESLDEADISDIEKYGSNVSETMKMTASELRGSVGDIKSSALKKVRDDLLHQSVYTEYYDGAEESASTMLITALSANGDAKSKVPALN